MIASRRDKACKTIRTVVSPKKTVAVLLPEHSAGPLLRLLHCNVHKAVKANEDACEERRAEQQNITHSCLSRLDLAYSFAAHAPLKSVPVVSRTTTGRPMTDLRKSLGERLAWEAGTTAMDDAAAAGAAAASAMPQSRGEKERPIQM